MLYATVVANKTKRSSICFCWESFNNRWVLNTTQLLAVFWKRTKVTKLPFRVWKANQWDWQRNVFTVTWRGVVKLSSQMLKNDEHRFKLSQITLMKQKYSFIKRVDEGSLWQRANARNVSFPNLSLWYFNIYQLVR